MLKKINFILTVLSTMFVLSGCLPSIGSQRDMQLGGSEARSAMSAEQIVEAFKEKNKETIISLFSESALDEIEDIDGEIENLFSFCEGEVISWELHCRESRVDIENGEKREILYFNIYAETKNKDITVYVTDYNMDAINPEDEGLYSLQVYEDKWDYTWTLDVDDTPGIHMPEKEKIDLIFATDDYGEEQ